MKICDMCKEKITKEYSEKEYIQDIKICLGTESETYDLCETCTEKVGNFVRKNIKKIRWQNNKQ